MIKWGQYNTWKLEQHDNMKDHGILQIISQGSRQIKYYMMLENLSLLINYLSKKIIKLINLLIIPKDFVQCKILGAILVNTTNFLCKHS